MQLTRAEDYGLIFLAELAKRPGEFVSVAQIAERFHISPLFLNKIILQLRRDGILRSKEGKSGGYQLGVHPEKITMKRILETLSGNIFLNACKTQCDKGHLCGYKKTWEKINKKFLAELENITLKEFIYQ